MNWILKNKKINRKTILIGLFFVAFFALFHAFIGTAKAACLTGEHLDMVLGSPTYNKCVKDACSVGYHVDTTAGPTYGRCVADAFKCPSGQHEDTSNPGKCLTNASSTSNEIAKAGTFFENPFTVAIIWLLTQVQKACAWLFAIAATLFAWVINPANISGDNGILNKSAVKAVWIMVRDTLNMAFILVLLFAAFCTIFQIEKWNLKKVWLAILINALLVNFSYPIARFFIDVSNVAFYYFVNNMFTSTGTVDGNVIMASFGSASNLSATLSPTDFAGNQIAYLLATIILIFIMGMTLLIIAALFIVRMIALTMLVMFSPIGFVGYIFPSTVSYADDWWKKLFSYSFFAPIMIFVMLISLKILEVMKSENYHSFTSNASANAGEGSSWIAAVAFYMIPVIILWMGMGIAKSMSVMGANTVTDGAQKFSKNMGMKFSGANWAKKNVDAFKASRKKRAEELDKKRLGSTLGNKANDLQDKAMAKMGSTKAQKRFDARKDAANKEDIKKQSEKFEGTTEHDLHKDMQYMNQAKLDTMNDDEIKEAAGKVKQALSRGATYEKHIEKTLKSKAVGHVGLSGNAKPRDVVKAVINAGMSSGAIAMERDREKAEKDALDKWVQEEKVAHMEQSRNVIKEAEKRGKLKQ